MNEEFREDRAFLAGIRTALESDAGVDAARLAAIRLAALREQRARRAAGLRFRMSAPLRVAAVIAVLAGLAWLCTGIPSLDVSGSRTLQTIALIGEADEDESGVVKAPTGPTGVEQLLALQDAPYYEAVANAADLGDNSEPEFCISH